MVIFARTIEGETRNEPVTEEIFRTLIADLVLRFATIMCNLSCRPLREACTAYPIIDVAL